MSQKNDSQLIQEKMAQLDALVAWFDSDDFQLEAASEKLKAARELAVAIEHDLENVENEITIVKRSFATDEA